MIEQYPWCCKEETKQGERKRKKPAVLLTAAPPVTAAPATMTATMMMPPAHYGGWPKDLVCMDVGKENNYPYFGEKENSNTSLGIVGQDVLLETKAGILRKMLKSLSWHSLFDFKRHIFVTSRDRCRLWMNRWHLPWLLSLNCTVQNTRWKHHPRIDPMMQSLSVATQSPSPKCH